MATLSFINEANSAKRYGETVRFGLTKFSDLTDDEFKNKYLLDDKTTAGKYRMDPIDLIQKLINDKEYLKYELPKNLPLKIDWREKGVISDVRNQGHCGSCYAQSVIGTIESLITLNYNLSKPLELSVQQMIDCGGNFNRGCLGGDTCDLLKWLKTEKIQIFPRKFYPESEISSTSNNEIRKCKNITLPDYVKTGKVLQYTCLDFTGYEYEIINILAHKGPLAASVNGLLWKNYLGGIIKYHCNGPSNHAIEIVGYDLSPPDPYYIVRNSWGIEFGNSGYAKIAFGQNVCNIASEISTVEVEWS
ncbi:cathepsin O-like [Condylostylus longicornis]|uniref:cathepsin O-like n=1 Tax=Condylostylus longicornis TaxID=2530218 RepID=UPI00244E31B3|nr:cathepsin O-like [Condylostylus longicornis]